MASALKRDPVSKVAGGGGPLCIGAAKPDSCPHPARGLCRQEAAPLPETSRLAPTGICVTQRPRPEVGIHE